MEQIAPSDCITSVSLLEIDFKTDAFFIIKFIRSKTLTSKPLMSVNSLAVDIKRIMDQFSKNLFALAAMYIFLMDI